MIRKAIIECDKDYVTMYEIEKILNEEEDKYVFAKHDKKFFVLGKLNDEIAFVSLSAYFEISTYTDMRELIESESFEEMWVCDTLKEMIKKISDEM